MGYVRYFAESPVSLKALSAAIKSIEPAYKIDGGDLMRGTDVLAEVGIDSAGTDMFVEDLSAWLATIDRVGSQAAQWVGTRLRSTQSIVAVRVDAAVEWNLLDPLWTSLANLSTGLMQVDGQGFYDRGN